MEGVNGSPAEEGRKPLSEMVDDCVQRWFQDTLKEARRGDTAMQVLVAQMYNSGYGIPRNEHKQALGSASWPLGPIPCRFHDFTLRRDRRSRQWMEKASRYRSSVWRVGTKRPGYNASDSDSDEGNDDIKQ
ncbi:unnamed protein product [Alopecurus aequalis]